VCEKEYVKNLKMIGYNNIISRQLLIKFEQDQMKEKEMLLDLEEDLVDQELRHACVRKNHEEFVKRKTEVLDDRRKSARKIKMYLKLVDGVYKPHGLDTDP